MERLLSKLPDKHVLFPASFALRLALVAYGDYQDRTMAVKYTDIDYHVFTDAARFITQVATPLLSAADAFLGMTKLKVKEQLLLPFFSVLLRGFESTAFHIISKSFVKH